MTRRGVSRAHLRRESTAGLSLHTARGFALMEFIIALLIFTVGMSGVLSAQLAAKRATFEAHQYAIANTLAADILTKIAANPEQVEIYAAAVAGDSAEPLPAPEVDCSASACSPEQLAAYDLWRWEAALFGANATSAGAPAGGLVAPRACFRRNGRLLTLGLSWRGASPSDEAPGLACGALVAGLYDAADGEPGNNRLRRQLELSILLAGSP